MSMSAIPIHFQIVFLLATLSANTVLPRNLTLITAVVYKKLLLSLILASLAKIAINIEIQNGFYPVTMLSHTELLKSLLQTMDFVNIELPREFLSATVPVNMEPHRSLQLPTAAVSTEPRIGLLLVTAAVFSTELLLSLLLILVKDHNTKHP